MRTRIVDSNEDSMDHAVARQLGSARPHKRGRAGAQESV